ncbi:Insulinase [Spironucleus salmonicida]|uniref:Insulinase n=1 Tax=Spironucleus salmonicida TaxID=348837 RepID=V6LI27_9EUKA|nr:Insulinase [Spironucleus salmonicida]|eukprot:EST43973.1 Metalloprotease, insulinase family protein [Spironucleus salmonicida]
MKAFQFKEEFIAEDLKVQFYQHNTNNAKFYKVYDSYITKDCTFSISFFTPSQNSKGIQHIIEHSVLCGSQKYQLKEPFTTLLQTSFQTYLNAGTYSEHTEYPVSSRNVKDFYNLVDVYLDAVFHPLLLQNPDIFYQEGFHQEIIDNKVINSGVVYNEMKAGYSDPQQLGITKLRQILFQDMHLQHDSGGDPEQIVQLTFQELVSYYSRYYTPDNAIIVIHGPTQLQDDLKLLNIFFQELLPSNVNFLQDIQQLNLVFQNESEQIQEFASQDPDAQAYQIIGSHLCNVDELSPLQIQIFNLIKYLLFESETSPVIEYFQSEQLADSVEGSFVFEEFYGYLYIVLQGVDGESDISLKNHLISIIQQCIGQQEGKYFNYISKDILLSAIKYLKFVQQDRQEEYGVELCANITSAILYNLSPIYYLNQSYLLNELEKLNTTGQLLIQVKNYIQQYLVNNQITTLLFRPSQQMYIQKSIQHDNYQKQILSEEYLKEINLQTSQFKHYQSQKDSEQELDKLPQLQIEEIGIENMKQDLQNSMFKLISQDLIFINNNDNQIITQDLYFNISNYSNIDNLLQWKLLTFFYFNLITEQYSSRKQLQLILDSTLGDYECNLQYQDHHDRNSVQIYFNLQIKFLKQSKEEANTLLMHIISSLQYSMVHDRVKMLSILQDYRSQFESGLQGEDGYDISKNSSQSKFSKASQLSSYTDGIPMYEYLQALDYEDDDEISNFFQQLDKLQQILLTLKPLIIVGCASQYFEQSNLKQIIAKQQFGMQQCLSDEIIQFEFNPIKYISTSIDINYVSVTYGLQKYNGFWILLEHIMNNTILWDEMRVKRGAYGCSIQSSRTHSTFSTYRDPNILETISFFKDILTQKQQLGEILTNKKLKKLKIGCFAGLQLPSTSSQLYNVIKRYYFNKRTYNFTCTIFDEIQKCTKEDIFEAFDYLTKQHSQAVFGTSQINDIFPNAQVI